MTRRYRAILEHDGERLSVPEWATRLGMLPGSLRERLEKMPVAEALSSPKRAPFRHGRSRTPIHNAWATMIARCTSPRSQKWDAYGGRGIRVCERWLTFENFLADMGERPSPGHTIERLDADGDYAPDNCCWATQKEQQRNRRNNKLIAFNGETMCVAAWAERTGIKQATLGYRIRSGWSAERALTVGAMP